jgi:hypothetical protein
MADAQLYGLGFLRLPDNRIAMLGTIFRRHAWRFRMTCR